MSSEYEVLANRYRPKVVDDMVGQPTAMRILKGMLTTGRVPRTMLVFGPHGSGKTTIARIFARYLNCQESSPSETDKYPTPCGKCKSCLSIDNGTSTDIHEIDAASSRGIDSIREIKEQSRFKPLFNYRIYILDEVHAMTPQAFQAALKLLEEPPPKTKFILCTTEIQRLPYTIVSRATKIPIKPVTVKACTRLLTRVAEKEKIDASSSVMEKIAIGVRSHPRDALQALEALSNVMHALKREGKKLTESDLSLLIKTTIKEVIGQSYDEMVVPFLLSIYEGRYTTALKVARMVDDNPSAFLEIVLRYHTQTIQYIVSPKLRDPYFSAYYKTLAEKKFVAEKDAKEDDLPLTPEMLSDLMHIFCSTATSMKQYLVSPDALLTECVMRAATTVRRLDA